MDAVSEIRFVKIVVAMKKLLLWQQRLPCVIPLTDLLQRSNFVAGVPSAYRTHLPDTKSISVAKTPKLFKF